MSGLSAQMSGLDVGRWLVDEKKTDVIMKINDTVHTAGIFSFSMYRHLTQPFDGTPKTNAETRFKAFCLIN